MSPSKKRKETTLPPGKSIEIGFTTAWRNDKDEVEIITDDGKIVLDGKNELILEISASNADPVRVKIIPDFNKRVLNFIEVIDVNAKQITDENKAKIAFVGMSIPKYDTVPDTVPIDQYLKIWDENIEKFGKQIKDRRRSTTMIVILNTTLTLFNLYMFITGNWPARYLNLIAVIISGSLTYYLWSRYRKLCKEYGEYKNLRSQAFEVAKDR